MMKRDTSRSEEKSQMRHGRVKEVGSDYIWG